MYLTACKQYLLYLLNYNATTLPLFSFSSSHSTFSRICPCYINAFQTHLKLYLCIYTPYDFCIIVFFLRKFQRNLTAYIGNINDDVIQIYILIKNMFSTCIALS